MLANLLATINGQFGMPCFTENEVEAQMVGPNMLEIRILRRCVLIKDDGSLARAYNVPGKFSAQPPWGVAKSSFGAIK